MIIENGEVISIDLSNEPSVEIQSDGNIFIGKIPIGTTVASNTGNFGWPYYPTTPSPGPTGINIGGYNTSTTGVYTPPADFNKVVEVKELYYLVKFEKSWTAYPIINVTYNSYGSIDYYTILRDNGFNVIHLSLQQEKHVIANDKQIKAAIERGVEIEVDCPSDLLTEDEESVKEIVE